MVQTDVLNNTNVLNNCIKMPIPISKANTNLKYTHSSSYWSFLTLSHYRLPWLKNLRTSIVPYPMLFLDSSGMNLPSESCANILLLLQNCRSPTIICLLRLIPLSPVSDFSLRLKSLLFLNSHSDTSDTLPSYSS